MADTADAVRKLRKYQINNLLIISHGNTTKPIFYIGRDMIDNHKIDNLDWPSDLKVNNLILYACMVANSSKLPGKSYNFGGLEFLKQIARKFSANVFGNQGYTYVDFRNGLNLFNDLSQGIFWVTAGLPAHELYDDVPEIQLQYDFAGRWLKVSPSGNFQQIRRALYFCMDGTFNFTEYDWRAHPNISHIIRSKAKHIQDTVVENPSVEFANYNGYGGWEGSPDYDRALVH